MIDLTNLAFWHWWVAAFIFAILEMLMPGTFLIWLAAAAGLVGFLMLLVPAMPWELQYVVFAVGSVAAIAGWRAYKKRHPDSDEKPELNKRGVQYVGQVVRLETPIVNGQGKARVGDTLWKVRGPDLPAGANVRVTGVDGTQLVVEKAD